MLSTILFGIITSDLDSTIYCSILFTTMNNVDNKTLFNPVFIQNQNTLTSLISEAETLPIIVPISAPSETLNEY